MKFNKIKLAVGITTTLFLAACANSSNTVEKLPFVQANEQELFTGAQTFIVAEDYRDADRYLTQLQLQYPFSQYTEEARTMAIYANYRSGDTLKTAASLDRFFKDIPNSRYADFALYVKALNTVENDRQFLFKIFNLNVYKRNVVEIRQAIASLYNLEYNYPKSPYTAASKDLITYLESQLALHELYVANFYHKYDNPLAVISRAQVVINNFPNSYYAKESYALQIEAYKRLKLDNNLAQAQAQYDALAEIKDPRIKFPKVSAIELPFALKVSTK